MSHILNAEETFFVATKVCLFYRDQLLILSESYPGLPLWRELPWWKISKADTVNPPLFTLRREVTEELWLNIHFHEGNTTLFHIEKRYEKTTRWDTRAFLFLCYFHELSEQPKLTLSEYSSFSWISWDQITTLSEWRPWFDEIVKKAFSIYLPIKHP